MNLVSILGDVAAVVANPVAGLAKVALDVAPEIASWFGDDAEEAVTKIADTVKAVTGTEDPMEALAALKADPSLILQMKMQAQTVAANLRMAELATHVELAKAAYSDRDSARSRDVEMMKTGRNNVRANVLLVTAGLGIVGGLALMVFGGVNGDSAVGGCFISVITLLASKFGTAFDFEFGGSADSDSVYDKVVNMASRPDRKP